ncbi:TetR family transcriptional regulator [Microbacterium sp.]|uniref:TetR/AcrR family transcriptional regulator n=1 Tax=Microbacterium sp. TaxID=51671 RepID=UPI002812784C|nr:TetR family transcriptional regulator [Microbacterium sp.]
MARNDDRRAALADAGIRVLAESGARGLTHRAVDAAAGAPRGTASNYFPTRDALIAELVGRIEQRLTPDPDVLAARAAEEPTRALFATYIRDVVARLAADPDVSLALFELRLEAARRPAVADALSAWRRRGFDADVAFNEQAGLPGTRAEIALFHYAIDGLMLDRLTVPIDPDTSTDDIVDQLVTRLLP